MLTLILITAISFFPQTPLDMTTIISKSEQEVEAVLGSVEQVEAYIPVGQKCECERLHYRDGQIRIIYKNGKADRIYISYEITLVNLDKIKINSFHKWKDQLEIRVTKVESCCATS